MNREASTLYLSDFLIESRLLQCEWCGAIESAEHFRVVAVDEATGEQVICQECLESYDWKHTHDK